MVSTERLRSGVVRFGTGGWGAALGVILFAIALRLYRIDYQSLWGNEALSLPNIQFSLNEIAFQLAHNATNTLPPLYFTLCTAGLTCSDSVRYRQSECPVNSCEFANRLNYRMV